MNPIIAIISLLTFFVAWYLSGRFWLAFAACLIVFIILMIIKVMREILTEEPYGGE